MQQTSPMTEKQQFWLKHIEAHKLSGESRIEYCNRHGLKSDHMSYFKKHLKQRDSSGKAVSNFVKIAPPAAENLTIRFSPGIAIEFPSSILGEVIRSLREIY